MKQIEFGNTSQGEQVSLFIIQNRWGTILRLTDFGAIVVGLETVDRRGQSAEITLGFQTLDRYIAKHPSFGSTVGRFCNRIARGEFSLDGQRYALAKNNGDNHLHGGVRGFDKYLWQSQLIQENGEGVVFSRISPDGEEGYPGNLRVTVTYLLTDDNELKIEFTAQTDRPTPLNLTNHCYWNLAGTGSGTILDHELMLSADRFLAVDSGFIPTGVQQAVTGTPLDFTVSKRIGTDFAKMVGVPGGYDHCFVLRSQDGSLALAARASDPGSGRVMEVFTTQPGIQFYTGNFLDGSTTCGGFAKNTGFCLETQHFPDSPNQPSFPSTILRPGATFKQTTVHKFSVA